MIDPTDDALAAFGRNLLAIESRLETSEAVARSLGDTTTMARIERARLDLLGLVAVYVELRADAQRRDRRGEE
jgi:hypothetical protein